MAKIQECPLRSDRAPVGIALSLLRVHVVPPLSRHVSADHSEAPMPIDVGSFRLSSFGGKRPTSYPSPDLRGDAWVGIIGGGALANVRSAICLS